MKKALLIDDHEIVREGLRLLLETMHCFSRIDEASDGDNALRYLEVNEYDVIFLDLRMPKVHGLQVLAAMEKLPTLHEDPTVLEHPVIGKVIVLTTYDDSVTLTKIKDYPIAGFLVKDASKDEILTKVYDVLNQKEVKLSGSEINDLKSLNFKSKVVYNSITKREDEVLHALVRGYTSKEIAHNFRVSERTIKAHLTSIYRKLGVSSRTEAVSMVLQQQNWR